jgi:hypothetical protein
MQFRSAHRLIGSVGLIVVFACYGGGEAGEEADVEAALPDTTAESVWAYVQDAGYTENWALWPEKGRLYEGQEPHGMLLTTYVNTAARDAVLDRAGTMPEGAIIVKENYMPDSTLAAVTVMYKASGYNPENNDWFFIKRLADGTVEASGRVEGCQNCHGAARANDYILTSQIGQ